MDPLKIALFLAAFGLLLVIARALARAGESRIDSTIPPSLDTSPVAGNKPTNQESPALTGAEFGMPIPLPPVERMEDGSFNRPIVTNYYFGKIDLARGPADPACFHDEFFLEVQDPETQARWTNKCTVVTPAGLTQIMNENKFDSVYMDETVVIVARWDLSLILKTVIEEATKVYRSRDGDSEEPARV